MKRLLFVLGLLGVLSVPAAHAAFDGTINISGSAGTYGGGPFNLDVTSGLNGVVGGNGLTGAAGSAFRTFCIEYNEHITLPGNYNANLNTQAEHGSGGPNPDPISLATAWLYSQFRAGTLAASVSFYNTGTYADNATGNNSLQQAIWWLEQETSAFGVGAPSGSELSFNNYLVTTAVLATGAADADAARLIDANGAYGVFALNLYSGTTTYNQDMLSIAVPEPSTIVAGALLLLPFGASTIKILRKKRAA